MNRVLIKTSVFREGKQGCDIKDKTRKKKRKHIMEISFYICFRWFWPIAFRFHTSTLRNFEIFFLYFYEIA